MRIRRYLLRAVLPAVTLAVSGFAAPAAADAGFRCVHPEQVGPSHGTGHFLDRLRDACPLLGRIVEEFALRDLGEVPEASHDDAIGTIVTLAASGDTASARQHAERALRSGATRDELREAVYLTVLNAGVNQAIEMTRELSELLIDSEQDEHAMLIEASEG